MSDDLTHPWAAELARRVCRYTVPKIVGICAFTSVFFIAYFYLLRHPVYPVTLMPLTALDRMLPFQPHALVAYVSLWIYIGCAPGLLVSLRELLDYTLWMAALCLAGLGCFYLWPTAVPSFGFEGGSHAGFALLEGVDAPGNACPSLHVATAMFTAIWVDYELRTLQVPTVIRGLNGGWFLAIAYSTLAIKQHVTLDVLAGALLGGLFAFASLRWRQRQVIGHRP